MGANRPTSARGAAAVLRNGVIYVVGGNRGGHGVEATTYGWMDAYNIATGKWSTNLPAAGDLFNTNKWSYSFG